MKYAQSVRVRLGAYELDLRSGELLGGEQRVLLREQPLQVLRMLVDREGELVSRDEIQKRLWPNDTIVEFDHSINAAIKNLRRALGDSATEPKYIETLARRGYRLMVPVERLSGDDSSVELPAASAMNDGAAVPPAPEPVAAAAPEPVAAAAPESRTESYLTYPDAPIFAVDELIVDRYKVLRFIAKGGMGQVYEVNDLELKTRVALKTIAPERASSRRQVDRFRQEIQLARTVGHPNVCRVFDLGRQKDERHGEVLFLTMEFVPGETLSARLRREGPMTCEQALPLIRQMVSGLAAAHELSIVHRDFKPGNVMLLPEGSGPGLKITDFGLATNPEQQITISGTSPEVVGTPAYMAPEQFRGQCSNRTDIYALGVTVFQMLTGTLPASYESPFRSSGSGSNKLAGKAHPSGGKAQSDSGKLKAIGAKAQSTESETTRRIGQRWRDAITTAMAANPDARFETVEEFWYALSGERPAGHTGWKAIAHGARRHRWLYAASACAVIAVIALFAAGIIRNPFRGRAQERHLAVLPFLNIGNDPTDKAFAEGISETLTSRLSQLERFEKSFWVVPAGDARTVKSPEEAHRDLDVTLAVTGSVQRTQDGVEVTTNLIDAANHRQLASRTLHVPSISLEDLQQQVWEAVADMLDLQVPAEVKAELAAGGTSHPEAYRLYEEANGYLRGSNADIDRAIDLFTKSLAIDSQYAAGYAGLGEAYAAKYDHTKDPQWMAKATQNAGRAVELNDRLIPARMSLARVYLRTGQLDKSLAEFKRVLEQDPTVTDAEYGEAWIYEAQGHFRQAEEIYKHAIARHPTYQPAYVLLGMLYYNTGHFNQAVQHFQSAVDLAPDETNAYYDLGAAYIALGRYGDAIGVLKKGLSIKPNAGEWSNLGAAYMYLGKWDEAADAMKRATELSPRNDDVWRNLGDAYDQIPSRLADARQAYQKALELATEQLKVNPKDPDVLSDIALYYAHLGHSQDAESYIAHAIEVSPNNSNVLFTSALVYEIIGHREKALSAVEQAAKAGYSVEEINKEPELRKLRTDPGYQQWLQQQKVFSGPA